MMIMISIVVVTSIETSDVTDYDSIDVSNEIRDVSMDSSNEIHEDEDYDDENDYEDGYEDGFLYQLKKGRSRSVNKRKPLKRVGSVLNIMLPIGVIENYQSVKDAERYGLSLPIECPSEKYELSKTRRCQVKCIPCEKGCSAGVKQSSFRPRRFCDIIDERCPPDTRYSTANTTDCRFPCECDLDKCAYGDPHACNISENCDKNFYLTKEGNCVKCPEGYSKPEIGCHGCMKTKLFKRYAPHIYMPHDDTILSTPVTAETPGKKLEVNVHKIKYFTRCGWEICTFPYQYCIHEYLNPRCEVCDKSMCSRKHIRQECGFYCHYLA